MLGIIGAMEEEVAKFISDMQDKEVVTRAGLDLYRGKINSKEVVVVKSGIGKVNAALCTQVLIDTFDVDAIINTGIAGSLDAKIDIGDIVLSKDVLQHDVDATNFGYPLGQIPRMDTLSFPGDDKMIEVAGEACKAVLPQVGLHVGRIVSGDQFISSREVKNNIVANFGGYATEMEGAAIGQVAYVNKVPFLVVRAISDKADDSATMDYPAFEAMAIENMVSLVKEFIDRM